MLGKERLSGGCRAQHYPQLLWDVWARFLALKEERKKCAFHAEGCVPLEVSFPDTPGFLKLGLIKSRSHLMSSEDASKCLSVESADFAHPAKEGTKRVPQSLYPPWLEGEKAPWSVSSTSAPPAAHCDLVFIATMPVLTTQPLCQCSSIPGHFTWACLCPNQGNQTLVFGTGIALAHTGVVFLLSSGFFSLSQSLSCWL